MSCCVSAILFWFILTTKQADKYLVIAIHPEGRALFVHLVHSVFYLTTDHYVVLNKTILVTVCSQPLKYDL